MLRTLTIKNYALIDDLSVEFDGNDETDAAWERYLLEYSWGSVWTRPCLDLQSRVLCVLTAQTIIGTDRTLANFIRAAVRLGLTETQVKELFFHLTFYIGVPPARRAMDLAKQIFTVPS